MEKFPSQPAIEYIAVFCGSRKGKKTAYQAACLELGRQLAERDIELIYGGGDLGLMGELAEQVLNQGGRVTGIIPRFLQDLGIRDPGITQLISVADLHERKRLLFKMADAYLVLPGGLGTIDEFIEIVTWKQLGLHQKPVVVINIEGYWNSLDKLVKNVIENEFAHPAAYDLFSVVDTVDQALLAIKENPPVNEEVLTSHLQS